MASPQIAHNQYHHRFDSVDSGRAERTGASTSAVEKDLVEFQGLSRDFAAGLRFPGAGSAEASSSAVGTPSSLTTASTAPSAQTAAASGELYPEFNSFDSDPAFLKEKPFANLNFGSTPSATSAATSAAQSPAMAATMSAAPVPAPLSEGPAAHRPQQSVGAFSINSVRGVGIAPAIVNDPSLARQNSNVARLEAAAEAASVGSMSSRAPSNAAAQPGSVPPYPAYPAPAQSAQLFSDPGPASSASAYAPPPAAHPHQQPPLAGGQSTIPFGAGPPKPLPQPGQSNGPAAAPGPVPNGASTTAAGVARPPQLPGDAADDDDDYESYPQGSGQRTRPNSFFGLNAGQSDAAAAAAAGSSRNDAHATPDTGSSLGYASALDHESMMTGGGAGGRPSSFFGAADLNVGGPLPGTESGQDGQTQASRIAAYHRGETLRSNGPGGSPDRSQVAARNPPPINTNVSGFGNSSAANTPVQQLAERPVSVAPSMTTGALLNHSHLKPGQQAALLSHNKTLQLYRQNARKTNDPNLIYEFAVFMIDASKTMGMGEEEAGMSAEKIEAAREELVKEAMALLKKVADRGHADSQYFLADCYANGIGTPGNKQAFDKAYPLFILAAKHGHPDAAYRAGTCQEKGWGCRKEAAKALQFYRKAASQGHPGAMYRLATAELNGELGLKKSAKEGVKWLKRSAEAASPEFPHALHELALLHERGVDNVVFQDPEYACELLAQSAEMGYAPSAYKLGVNYEYGRMGCPQDGGLSIHMYNIAAQQNHKEACFALTAWYLVGAPGILPQSDTEAYLWAKKAAEQGLAKAEYAVGYFTEMGIGTVKDLREARKWYASASEHGDRRANQRLAALDRMSASGLGPQSRRPGANLPQAPPPVEAKPSQPRNFDPRLSQWIADPDAADRRKQAGFRTHRQDSRDSYANPPSPANAVPPPGARPMSMAPQNSFAAYAPVQPQGPDFQRSPIGPPTPNGAHPPPGTALPGPMQARMQMGGPPSPREREDARVQQRLALLNKQQQQQQMLAQVPPPNQQYGRPMQPPPGFPNGAMPSPQQQMPPPAQHQQQFANGDPRNKKGGGWFK